MTSLPTAVEELIAGERHVAHLATSVGDRPHAAPLWYRYDGDAIEIATTGQKLANLRRNPRLALSIQSSDDGMPAWMVTIRGTATIVDDEEASAAGRARIHEKYGADPDAFPENVLVRIEIDSVAYRRY